MLTKRFGIAAMGLLIACGCNQGAPGGPGVHNVTETQVQTSNKPVIDNAKETFSLRAPVLSTSLKQGESKSTSIAIQRGSDFKGDVKLAFNNIPSGVTLEPMNPVIKPDDKEVKIQLSADDQAVIGDYKITIKGMSSEGGPEAVNDLKVSVAVK